MVTFGANDWEGEPRDLLGASDVWFLDLGVDYKGGFALSKSLKLYT